MMSLAVAAVAQESDRELFREAERRFESGDYELALDRYNALIRTHPLSQFVPDAQYRVALSMYRTGRPEDALTQLRRVERRYRSTRFIGYVPFWQGVISYDVGAFAEATEFLRDFQAGRIADPEALAQSHYYLALTWLARENEAAARGELERMLTFLDEPAREGYALTLLLSLYVKEGLADELLDLTSRLDLTRLDERWRHHVLLYEAEAYYAKGEIDEAITRYRRSERAPAEVATLAFQRLFQLAQDGRIAEQPSDVLRRAEIALSGRTDVLKEFWLRVGIDSYNQRRYDIAELYFRRIWDFRATEFIPASVPLYLARLLDQRGDEQGAEEVLSAYLDIYGDESEERLRVLVALGNLHLRLGRNSEAVATLAVAFDEFDRGPFFAEAAYQYAFALRESRRHADALATIDSAFTAGRTGGIQADLLRLRSRVLRDLGRNADALQSLYEYLPLRPDDAQAALEYVNLLFGLGRYARVNGEAPQIASELDRHGSLTPLVDSQLAYVRGLALLSLNDYAGAKGVFQHVLDRQADARTQRTSLRPYALYYRGWAAYREGAYRDAQLSFGTLLSEYPDHAQAAQAAYLSGWSSFLLGDYRAATDSLARVRSYPTSERLAIEARFLHGRALAAMGSHQQAAATFRSLYLDHPTSVYADDAWFEYAESQLVMRNPDAAVAAFTELLTNYPASQLAEPASFRRAEVLFEQGRYSEAQEAFFAYRSNFREGPRMDAALYWGGVASHNLGETGGALLLWERLISEFRSSPFRADAVRSAAIAHADRGEHRQALNLFTELQGAYPETAIAAGAERRINELVLLISGHGEREARLVVAIENSGGAESEAGREAIIELARMTIYESTATSTDAGSVMPMLRSVSDMRAVDPASAARALFLRGEYRANQEELQSAADLYLQAAAVGAADRDLAALSIYRAAVMYSMLGHTTEVNALVSRLRSDFPGSQWLEEARALQRGGSHE